MQTLLPFGIWHFTVYNISSAHRRIAASIVVLVYPFTFVAFPFVLHMYRLGQCPRIYLRAKVFFFKKFLKSRGFCLLILFDATFPSRELSHANAIFTRFVFILSASDECAAAGDDWSRQVCRGPRGAVPCGSVPILLPPSAFPARARTHQHHRDIKPATNPLVVVVIIPIPDTLVLSRLASSAARGSGNLRGEGERGRPRGSHRSSGRRWGLARRC